MTASKIKMVIIFIVIGALIITGAIGIWYYKTKFYIPDKDGMENDLSHTVVSCSYSTGGGMDGGSESLEIYLNENNEVWFEYYNRPYIGAEEESLSYKIDAEALEKVRQKCKEYGVLGWGKLEYSDMVILDAPTTTISFKYGDTEFYSVNSNYELPKRGEDFFSAFYEILNQYKTQGGN